MMGRLTGNSQEFRQLCKFSGILIKKVIASATLQDFPASREKYPLTINFFLMTTQSQFLGFQEKFLEIELRGQSVHKLDVKSISANFIMFRDDLVGSQTTISSGWTQKKENSIHS